MPDLVHEIDEAAGKAHSTAAVQDAPTLASDEWRASPPPDHREFVRFTRKERTLHICMVVSFISLALTGLTLKFSYTAWAVALSRLLGGFQTAGFIHRTAAVIMFAAFITINETGL